jgi:hypothetical protein
MSYFASHVKNGLLPLVIICIAFLLIAIIIFGSPPAVAGELPMPDTISFSESPALSLNATVTESPEAAQVRRLKNARDILASISVGSLVGGAMPIATVFASIKRSSHPDVAPVFFALYGEALPGLGLMVLTGLATVVIHGVATAKEGNLSYNLSLHEKYESDLARMAWIDRPGNDLKLSAYVVAGASVAMQVTAGFLISTGAHGSTATVSASLLLSSLPLGIVASGLFGGGLAKARNAEAASAFSVAPYVAPALVRSDLGSGATIGGATVGVQGTF